MNMYDDEFWDALEKRDTDIKLLIGCTEEEIFKRCIDSLSVKAEKCVYVGDGGSNELEATRKLGMKAVQAAWYLQEGTTQPLKRKHDFCQMEKPVDVLNFVHKYSIQRFRFMWLSNISLYK